MKKKTSKELLHAMNVIQNLEKIVDVEPKENPTKQALKLIQPILQDIIFELPEESGMYLKTYGNMDSLNDEINKIK